MTGRQRGRRHAEANRRGLATLRRAAAHALLGEGIGPSPFGSTSIAGRQRENLRCRMSVVLKVKVFCLRVEVKLNHSGDERSFIQGRQGTRRHDTTGAPAPRPRARRLRPLTGRETGRRRAAPGRPRGRGRNASTIEECIE